MSIDEEDVKTKELMDIGARLIVFVNVKEDVEVLR